MLLCFCGCAQKLHPLLEEHHGGLPLSDADVDIRIERRDYVSLQVVCAVECCNLMSVLAFGTTFGCAKLRCATKKMWETEKMCTCIIWLPYNIDWPLNHEKNHCYGYQDVLY